MAVEGCEGRPSKNFLFIDPLYNFFLQPSNPLNPLNPR